MDEMWNLWHGCHKKSEGCLHCYVYRRDAEFEKDSNVVTKTSAFNLPVRRDRQGNWKVPSVSHSPQQADGAGPTGGYRIPYKSYCGGSAVVLRAAPIIWLIRLIRREKKFDI